VACVGASALLLQPCPSDLAVRSMTEACEDTDTDMPEAFLFMSGGQPDLDDLEDVAVLSTSPFSNPTEDWLLPDVAMV
jgi:hypothetical protein